MNETTHLATEHYSYQQDLDEPDLGGWFTVYQGKKFYILNPRAQDVDITDIAHSLSLICRFGGHVKEFYSVGNHLLYCRARSNELWPDDTLLNMHVLLHDAAEAYLGDIVRPYKVTLPSFSALEDRTMDVIYEALRLPLPTDEHYKQIKRIDNEVLMAERRDLLNHGNIPWNIKEEPWETEIQPIEMKRVESLFLSEYAFLRAKLISERV